MNYTTNYHLPQWVESDRILMEDFNEAMESIEELFLLLLTPDKSPGQYGEFFIHSTSQEDEILATFSFQPRIILVDFFNTMHIIPKGNYSSFTRTNNSNTYTVGLALRENTLELYSMDENIVASYRGYYLAIP